MSMKKICIIIVAFSKKLLTDLCFLQRDKGDRGEVCIWQALQNPDAVSFQIFPS